eukprot:TRINITY_DN10459_c0_g1_i1.p1 TRINITY_DN10459_c0_g1~~TRINITY_DN10459_c0_g1_i1.p1  ORF type:complete len:262 (-),score=115.04 TRINITY_DN10459_c0_g1_i1:12-761(-)
MTAVEKLQDAEKRFGFSPIVTIDNIINSANDYCCDAVDALEFELAKEMPSSADYIKRGADEILELMSPSIDTYLDKLELYLVNNCFSCPDWFVQSSYTLSQYIDAFSKNLEEKYDVEEQNKAIDEKIVAVLEQIRQTQIEVERLETLKRVVTDGKVITAESIQTKTLSQLQGQTSLNMLVDTITETIDQCGQLHRVAVESVEVQSQLQQRTSSIEKNLTEKTFDRQTNMGEVSFSAVQKLASLLDKPAP